MESPGEVRKSFAGKSIATRSKGGPRGGKEKRIQHSNLWPRKRLDYAQLEKAKEFLCRVKHPTGYYKRAKDAEYRVSILRWSQGAYIDVRMYYAGHPTAMGLLMHQDVAAALFPELFNALRTVEMEDTREEDKKAKPEVIKL